MAIQIRLSAPSDELDPAIDAARRAYTVVSVSGRRPNTKGDPGERVHLIATGPAGATLEASPLAQAEDAKRRRDLVGELDALAQADQELETQPWHPLQPGDVVLISLPPMGPGDEPYGETYLATSGEETDIAGNPMLQLVSSSNLELLGAATGSQMQNDPPPAPFYDLWFEAGPSQLTVIRAGRVVHGSPGGAQA